jgi:DNA-binding PadR family transcriptional regulator
MFRYVVLGLLQSGTARHGYALMKEYRDRAGVQVSTGNFYRDLQRLVSSGLVRTVDRAPDGDPRRAPYQITESGRDAFRQWFVDLDTARHRDRPRGRAVRRIAFLGDVDPPTPAPSSPTCRTSSGRARSRSSARAPPRCRRRRRSARGLPVLALMLGRRMAPRR